MNLDVGFIALTSEHIRSASTIDISSAITTSAGSGFVSLRLNLSSPFAVKSTSSNLWIVLAGSPVRSDIRFAALPVGAHRSMRFFCALRILITPFNVVVLPVPGPPVRINTEPVRQALIAAR